MVNLVAEADASYHFDNWTGDVDTIANVNATATTITMNDDYFITAKFAVEPQYILIITGTEGGEVTEPGEGVFSYDEGTVVDLVATPDAYYRFVNWTGDADTIDDVEAAATTITMNGDYFITANFGVNPMVAAGYSHTVGLKSDGTVVAVGRETAGQINVGSWTGIVQVAAGAHHTVGLKDNGTVVALGDGTFGRCSVGGWTGIVQVAAGAHHTVGLKDNGTVVALGDGTFGRCSVGGWMGIVQVAAGEYHTVGLESDGTVVAVGSNADGQCDVGGWTLIV